jgi:3-methyladenine DNA glycosylase AlkD
MSTAPDLAQRLDRALVLLHERARPQQLAALAVQDKRAPDERFLAALPLIEAAADDDRNFVRKAVNWALRNIGKRNAPLHDAAIACAQRIRARGTQAARWIAADALRELRARGPRGAASAALA